MPRTVTDAIDWDAVKADAVAFIEEPTLIEVIDVPQCPSTRSHPPSAKRRRLATVSRRRYRPNRGDHVVIRGGCPGD
jgi:hypothetical protein